MAYIKVAALIVVAMLVGCVQEEDRRAQIIDPVWSEEYVSIEITQGTGAFSFPSDISWVIDTTDMSTETINLLDSEKQEKFDLSCAADDETSYELIVTLTTGLNRRFVSSNKDCGHLNQFRFIPVTSFQALIDRLEIDIKSVEIELMNAKKIAWEGLNIDDYIFDFDHSCWGCNELSSFDFPVELTYVDNVIQAIDPFYSISELIITDSGTKFYNINELFTELESLLTSNPGYVRVNYNSTFHYPSKITYNPILGSVRSQDEKVYEVENFVTN